jgi:tRNA(Arg) A34 adenosine deaminase TadA
MDDTITIEKFDVDTISKRHQRYIDEAIKCALDGEMLYCHGGVLVKSGKVIGKTCNSYRTRYRRDNISSLHVERRLTSNEKGKNAILYVVRIVKLYNGTIRVSNSKPCIECIKLMIQAGVKKVVYSNGKGITIEKVRDVHSEHHTMGYRSMRLQGAL